MALRHLSPRKAWQGGTKSPVRRQVYLKLALHMRQGHLRQANVYCLPESVSLAVLQALLRAALLSSRWHIAGLQQPIPSFQDQRTRAQRSPVAELSRPLRADVTRLRLPLACRGFAARREPQDLDLPVFGAHLPVL